MDINAFLTMGGYAGFVWPAYGVAVVVMAALLVASLRGARAREGELDLMQQRRRNRRAAQPESQPK